MAAPIAVTVLSDLNINLNATLALPPKKVQSKVLVSKPVVAPLNIVVPVGKPLVVERVVLLYQFVAVVVPSFVQVVPKLVLYSTRKPS